MVITSKSNVATHFIQDNMLVLLIISAALLSIVLYDEVYAIEVTEANDYYNKHFNGTERIEIINVMISTACLNASCMNYCELTHLDQSIQKLSGKFIDENMCMRGPPLYDKHVELYTETKDFPGPIVMINVKSDKRFGVGPQLFIENDVSRSELKQVNNTMVRVEKFGFMDKRCHNGIVTNQLPLITQMIDYIKGDCEGEPPIIETVLFEIRDFSRILSPAAQYEKCIADSKTVMDYENCRNILDQ